MVSQLLLSKNIYVTTENSQFISIYFVQAIQPSQPPQQQKFKKEFRKRQKVGPYTEHAAFGQVCWQQQCSGIGYLAGEVVQTGVSVTTSTPHALVSSRSSCNCD